LTVEAGNHRNEQKYGDIRYGDAEIRCRVGSARHSGIPGPKRAGTYGRHRQAKNELSCCGRVCVRAIPPIIMAHADTDYSRIAVMAV